MKSKTWEFIKETVSIVVIAFILAMILRAFVIEGRIIPSSSMLPTLQVDTRVMVCKFAYWFSEPQRGDIIVFKPPEELNTEDDYIKRVIGLPGETVQVTGGKVYIDDRALAEPYLDEPPAYEFGPVTVPEDKLLVLGDNRNHSFDGHVWNAWLEQDNIKGRAFLIYWPVSEWSTLEREVGFE
ncbi:MAG: signal peptidase I [Syntrophomonadaceae bacterium]|nr:signal peptidase I [Syntrophomonadaceae bacterium]